MSETITCPKCQMTSYNPNDIREGYCGNCHDWTTPRPPVSMNARLAESEAARLSAKLGGRG